MKILHNTNSKNSSLQTVEEEVSAIQNMLNVMNTSDKQLCLIKNYLNQNLILLNKYSHLLNSMLNKHNKETEKLNYLIYLLNKKIEEIKKTRDQDNGKSAQLIYYIDPDTSQIYLS